ncbi:thiamine pyrophosphate-requiring protein [Plastoroseomonas hellenica]|uniref:thiamine pyrophosphate-requiring protein n=1 Tax=Plastoroseomonas hellenica TaxID=2687306 RepID=UPI001BA7E2AC|nr:thiamine pyrophosphate-requiring protein [Plastoroseomonas hellenica]MBR0641445.1 thiamine pyrophosphate-requiring protein [Plastoroseomonas hellenica]
MAETVGDFFWRRLAEWGVRRVFGYPGDGINGLLGALDRAQERLTFVQARHEEMAAFMAGAHSKYTGQVGVCVATSGPGAIHLLNGLYDARLDHTPVLAIVGQQARAALGSHYQQEVDLHSLFKDVAGAFVQQVTVPEQVRHLIDRAMRTCMAERRVACIIVPNDVQELDAVPVPAHAHGTAHSGVGYERPVVQPETGQLRRAADVLNSGSKVAMLVGAGALHATDAVMAVADALGAGVAKALLGKAAVSDDIPWVTGSIGLLGTEPSWEMMQACDTLLMVGSGFPYSEFLPREGQARGVQIDIKADMLSLRYPMEVNLHGDSQATLEALLPLLQPKKDRAWRQGIEKSVSAWWEKLEARAMQPAEPLNPQRVFWELSPRLPEGCIIAGDSGSHTNWYARDVKLRRGMMASLSGGLATMGSGVPYAIAAKFAYPDRPVLAICGDGAMQMNGMAELITIAKYWGTWADPRLIVLVVNNRDLCQVTWEQRALAGDPKFLGSQSIPDVPYHRFAELIGLQGIFVDSPDDVAAAWDQAFSANRPVVLEAYTDPNVPPLPPHITLKQAKAFLSSLAREPERGSVIRNTARDLIATILPGRSS